MNKNFKYSNISVLSTIAKASLIALPCAFMSIQAAHAKDPIDDPTIPNYLVTETAFPTVKVFEVDDNGDLVLVDGEPVVKGIPSLDENGEPILDSNDEPVLVYGELTEYYYNNIYSKEWGNNLIVNPSFDLCGAYVEPKVYELVTSGTLAALDNPTNKACNHHNGWMRWGWQATNGALVGGKWDNRVTKLQHVDNPNYKPPGVDEDGVPLQISTPPSNQRYYGRFHAPKEMRFAKAIEVSNINELYFSFDYAKEGHTDIIMRLELTPTGGEMQEIIFRPNQFDTENWWWRDDKVANVANKWSHTELAWQLDEEFTGTIQFFWNSLGGTPISGFDNVFLGTDVTLLPLPDSDEDGTHDGDDEFRDNHVAWADNDLDGLPDFFTAPECKELITAEVLDDLGEVETPAVYGDDFVECNGLTLDTDDDNDGDSDIDEVAAGTDPLDADWILADLDNDGWNNSNERGLAVNDAYPNSKLLHLAKDNYTNVLAPDYAPDAEAATLVANTNSTANTEWEFWDAQVLDAGPVIEIATGVDSRAFDDNNDPIPTTAFRLAMNGTAVPGKYGQLHSPLITPVATNAKVIRIAGWMKVTGPDLVPDDTAVSSAVLAAKTTTNNGAENKEYPLTFAAGENGESIYNSGQWHYIEQAFEFNAGIVSTSLQMRLFADIIGVEVLFDDLEVNFINSGDLDKDGILDANDKDDDNDGIYDGSDDTPLGDGAFDADLGYAPTASLDTDNDGVLNGYDDDFDGDGIANAFDDFHLAIIIDETTPVHDTEARTITIEAQVSENSADDPTLPAELVPEPKSASASKAGSGIVLQYDWTVTQIKEDVTTGNDPDFEDSFIIVKTYSGSPTLVVNELDFVADMNVVMELTVTTETAQGGTLVEKRVWERVIADDDVPDIELTMTHTTDVNAVFTVSSLLDEEDDALLISWNVDGVEVAVSDNATSLTLNYADYDAAASVVVTVTVNEVNRPAHSDNASLTWFIPAEKKAPYGGGSMNWWILTLLTLGLFNRRSNK